MFDDIKKWIESDAPDYTTGVALFSKYNRNKAILQWLSRVGAKRGMSKLVYELQRINKTAIKYKHIAMPVMTQKTTALKHERIQIDVEGKIKREDLPVQLQKLYDENVEKYKIMRGAHATMIETKHKNQRKKLRTQITQFDDKISANWGKIDAWAKTQILPDDNSNENIITDKLTPQQVNAFRTYISRYIAEPDKLDDKKHKKLQQRITAMINDNQSFDYETIEKLKSLGFNTESNIPAQD
ncbi:MAG: hypothetical protein LBF04_02225 [Prevotellaceae bacterium]|jgi:ribosomal protein L23|nr:hypothetical protein [Prevotellaceae bacterium]